MSLAEIPNCPRCGTTAYAAPVDDANEWDVEPDYSNRLKGTSLDCERCGNTFECYYY